MTAGDLWQDAPRLTPARVGLERAGDAVSTEHLLEFNRARAAARDALHTPMDVEALSIDLAGLGLGRPIHVSSLAADRQEYLLRPDLGRVLRDPAALEPSEARVGIVLADGLSPAAVNLHAPSLLRALVGRLLPSCSIAAPVLASQARVALGDHVGSALGVGTVIVLIGERPGLSSADSLGVYLTHEPRPGRTDAERNCVSNIHPPHGLGYAEAADLVTALHNSARRLGRSGVTLKAADSGQPGGGAALSPHSA